jgi:hypothetical protein
MGDKYFKSDNEVSTNPMTMTSSGNNEFMITASIIARATNTPVHGEEIEWSILEAAGNHGYWKPTPKNRVTSLCWPVQKHAYQALTRH